MKIYWSFMALAVVMGVISTSSYYTVHSYGQIQKRPYKIQCLLFFGVIVFFCGLRSGIADTGAYIHMFEQYPSNISSIEWSAVSKDKGFYFLGVLYKQFISNDYHGWLFLIALITGIALAIAFYNYASNFGLSCYLFIATTIFVYLVNGMRQFICVAIIFAASKWIADRKYIRFIVLILLLYPIHASVLMMIPLCFIVNAKPWSRRMIMLIGGFVIFIVGFNRFFPFLSSVMEETQYAEYAELIISGTGTSIFRLFIALVPCALAFLGKNIIKNESTPFIDMMINMSVINVLLYTVASISNGMVIGRLTVYFDIFNVLLLPWLIDHIFEHRSAQMVKTVCIVAYLLFFYYQMVLTWNLPYESDILKLFL